MSSRANEKRLQALEDRVDGSHQPLVVEVDRGGIITELGKLYREARRGEIDPYQATRLASILTVCGARWRLSNLSAASMRSKHGLPLVVAQD
jgi:hypothetical protein